jgi:formylglycine-generating enzyme required for sulfatase activity
MKKSFYLSFFLLFVLSSGAQDLREMRLVGDAHRSESEIVSRRDNNGNLTAGIMVISDMDGFSYDAYNGVVGNVDSRPGMDIVYLQTTERVLEIYKTGYRPLKIILADEGIRLKPQEVWKITVAGDEAANVLPVTFRFTPSDATLFIDGKDASGSLTRSLSVGDHQIRLEKEGYQTLRKTITVNEKQVFFEWQMEKEKDAIIEIETVPAGAIFYLDGVKLGETPFSEFFKPGAYPVRITKEGYVTIQDITLEVKAPATRKTYTLEENVGYLTVNTNREAQVFFNGEKISNHKNVKLPPQLVKVKVTQSKAEPLEKQVVLKRNDRISLDMFPKVKTATLQVAVTPFDAKTALTGDAGEYYTAEGAKIFADLPIGTYTLEVTAAGYETTTETIILRQGETQKRSVKLSKPESAVAENKTTTTTTATDYGIEMVFVKGGAFTMGCTSEQSNCDSDEKPTRRVTISDFYIGKYEVTQKQWRAVMGTSTDFGSAQSASLSDPSNFKGCDDCPVERVSWNDIQEFIKTLNQKTGKKYRLPTEAEWEFAARGGSAGSPTRYSGSNNIDEVAWYDKNSGSKTNPVGRKKANELGLFDMSGNVWEWCSDWYGSYSSGSQTNPQGPSSGSGRVLRGGGWFSYAQYCRVSIRSYGAPGYRGNYRGFRLALAP